MAEEKKNKFTRAGYEELQEELSNRKTVIKAEIGARIEEARATPSAFLIKLFFFIIFLLLIQSII